MKAMKKGSEGSPCSEIPLIRREQHICRLPIEKPKQSAKRVRALSDYKNITADNFFSPLNVAA
jgi:hypothetical protein